jgi:hypothetical protein
MEDGVVAVPLAHDRDGVECLADRAVPGGVQFYVQPARDSRLEQLVQFLVGEERAAVEGTVVTARLLVGRERIRLIRV